MSDTKATECGCTGAEGCTCACCAAKGSSDSCCAGKGCCASGSGTACPCATSAGDCCCVGGRNVKVYTGAKIPVIGLGVWKIPRDTTEQAVYDAIALGYRHLDCACDYGNEVEVGRGIARAIADGLVTRADLWVTSKLWNTYHAKEHVRAAFDRTLGDLGLEYLDLYLIHFPIALKFVPFGVRYPPEWVHDPTAATPRMETARVPLHETWAAMEELVDAGLVRHIGISNFGTAMIADLYNYARIAPAVLQIELHPYLTQEKLVRYAQMRGLHVTGYSPLGAGSYVELGGATMDESALNEKVVQEIATRLGRTPAQILLRWGIQRGISVVPKSTKKDRLAENIGVFDFTLSAEDCAAISALNRNRRFNDPGVYTQFFNAFNPIFD